MTGEGRGAGDRLFGDEETSSWGFRWRAGHVGSGDLAVTVSLSYTVMLLGRNNHVIWIFNNILYQNCTQKTLRLPRSTWPPAASLCCHVPPTQQPFFVQAHNEYRTQLGERGVLKSCPADEWFARSPGWRRIVKTWKSRCQCNSFFLTHLSAAVLCCTAVHVVGG